MHFHYILYSFLEFQCVIQYWPNDKCKQGPNYTVFFFKIIIIQACDTYDWKCLIIIFTILHLIKNTFPFC